MVHCDRARLHALQNRVLHRRLCPPSLYEDHAVQMQPFGPAPGGEQPLLPKRIEDVSTLKVQFKIFTPTTARIRQEKHLIYKN